MLFWTWVVLESVCDPVAVNKSLPELLLALPSSSLRSVQRKTSFGGCFDDFIKQLTEVNAVCFGEWKTRNHKRDLITQHLLVEIDHGYKARHNEYRKVKILKQDDNARVYRQNYFFGAWIILYDYLVYCSKINLRSLFKSICLEHRVKMGLF